MWTNTYMNFDLQDVSVCLVTDEYELACINFIKSSLTVDNYSNRTQDIDLVSQEILITDIRYQGEFNSILQAMPVYHIKLFVIVFHPPGKRDVLRYFFIVFLGTYYFRICLIP